jgi:HK97 family phage prohead protease
MSEIERRFLRGELRAVSFDEELRIIGYAAVFNALSENLGGWKEIILPGAFSNALEADVRALINHDPSMILGRTTSKTLTLAEDDIGLRYEIVPPKVRYAEDLIVSLERGDVDQSSFSFRAIEESWRNPTDEEPYPVRVLHEVELYDVSPVTFPAYPTTSAQVRDMAQRLAGQATDQGVAVGRLALRRRRLELMERE